RAHARRQVAPAGSREEPRVRERPILRLEPRGAQPAPRSPVERQRVADLVAVGILKRHEAVRGAPQRREDLVLAVQPQAEALPDAGLEARLEVLPRLVALAEARGGGDPSEPGA